MKDRRGNNEGVDPQMIGIEYADTKKGNHFSPRRLRWLRRDIMTADVLGLVPTRHAVRMSRQSRPAA